MLLIFPTMANPPGIDVPAVVPLLNLPANLISLSPEVVALNNTFGLISMHSDQLQQTLNVLLRTLRGL